MSSPKKQMKLTTTPSPRRTQDSRVTSTPQRLGRLHHSPDISRISSASTRSRLSEIVETGEETSSENSFSSHVLTLEEVVNFEDYFKNLGRINRSGFTWNLYKPIDQKSLYGHITYNPSNAEDLVRNFYLLYQRDKKAGVLSLIRLCVDICGFQNVSVSNVYKFTDNSAKELVSLLQSEEGIDQNPTLLKGNRYVFMESYAKVAVSIKMGVYYFINQFMTIGHENGLLYDDYIARNFFGFVKNMSQSQLRVIRHTGVVLATKLLTGVVQSYNSLINDQSDTNEESSSMMSNRDVENRIEQEKILKALVEYFYFVFFKNCRLADIKLRQMRVECIQELRIWISYFPKMFISDLQGQDYLLKLIIDGSTDVRVAALSALTSLLLTPHVFEFLKPHKKEIMEAVTNRFYDVDIQISIKAINLCSSLLEIDDTFISMDTLRCLTQLVFDNYFPIGEAACMFVKKFSEHDKNEPEDVIIYFARIALLPGDCRPQLVVEGCLHCVPEITNWNLLCCLILESAEELKILEILATILYESIKQTLTGKSSKLREKSRIVQVDAKHHTVVGKIVPSLNLILEKFSDHPKIFSTILKIYTLIDNNSLKVNISGEHNKLCQIIQKNFFVFNDETTLGEMVNLLNYLCETTTFSVRAEKYTTDIITEAVNTFLETLSNTRYVTYDDAIFLRVSMLYSKFDLNNKLSWELLFGSRLDDNENAKAQIMTCCKWYLIWKVRDTTNLTVNLSPRELSQNCDLLLSLCGKFVEKCFEMLQKFTGSPLHYKVYECICDLHLTYSDELEAPLKMNKLFERLNLKVENEQFRHILADFVQKNIFCNENRSLEDRRTDLIRYVHLVHCNILPIMELAHVFKFYYSHNADFDQIINTSINSMGKADDENIVLLMTFHTLVLCYEDILAKSNAVDIKTEEARNLKLLAKQFLTHGYFSTPKRHFKRFFYFALNYVFKAKSNYMLLYFLKYFTEIIDDVNDKKEIYDLFKTKLPNGAGKLDPIVCFDAHMKQIIYGASNKGKKALASKTNKTNTIAKTGAKAKQKSTKNTENKSTNTHTRQGTSGLSKKSLKRKAAREIETESSEDDMTIHDSESDDGVDVLMSSIRI